MVYPDSSLYCIQAMPVKDQTIKELTLVCLAVLILSICEISAFFLKPFLPPLAVIALTRSSQGLLLLLLLVRTRGGLAFAGLSTKRLWPGFKAGLAWSFGFGMVVIIAAGLMVAAGINPLTLIRSDIPGDKLALFFLTGTLIAPITEEIFFRGILYSFLRRWGVLSALVASTLVFAFFHVGPSGYGSTLPVIQLIGGLLFALSFEHSKSLIKNLDLCTKK